MIRSYKYRINPNTKQAAKLNEMLWAFSRLYNSALEERIKTYEETRKSVSYYQQAAKLKDLRATDPLFKQFSHTAKQKVLRRLDKAFKAFFNRVKRGDKPGFPRFKAANRFNTAEFTYGDGIRLKGNRIRIVGIPGGIQVRWHRALPDNIKLKAATVSRRQGKWFVVFQFEANDVIPVIPSNGIGIDMGLDAFIATNEGHIEKLPKFTKDNERELRKANRSLARRKKDSLGWKQAKRRVQKIHNSIRGQREIFLHKQSKKLIEKYDVVVLENLNVKGLARGMLAKSVNNAAWGKFVQILAYKAANAGKTIEFVNPAYTSQTCPSCGNIKPKTLAQRIHQCECGCVMDRDVAAAINIFHKSFYWLETSQESLTYQVAECVDSKAVCFS